MTISSLMLDIEGTSLTNEDIEILRHPLTGGVIFFQRNFHDQAQIAELCQSIHKIVNKPLVLAVDQEGGRVQRFHQEFTTLPAMGAFQSLECSEDQLLQRIRDTGWLMASELVCSGVDISFAPVLDIDSGLSLVIGDRGFSDNPNKIISYATAFIKGMAEAGMSSTGKHFPGHGSTEADSHFNIPIDDRSLDEIRQKDFSIFAALCDHGLNAIMPAHVIYPQVDSLPACFSPYWLKTVLRKELNFEGMVFSDDLSMEGAKVLGDITSRAKEALAAGCDMILSCNDRESTIEILDSLPQVNNDLTIQRVQSMKADKKHSFEKLRSTSRGQSVRKMLQSIQSLNTQRETSS